MSSTGNCLNKSWCEHHMECYTATKKNKAKKKKWSNVSIQSMEQSLRHNNSNKINTYVYCMSGTVLEILYIYIFIFILYLHIFNSIFLIHKF